MSGHSSWRRLILVFAVMAIPHASGCGSSPQGMGDILDPAAAAWPWRPATMRIHPLTRIHVTEEGPTAVIRIELLDVDGHPTKGVGQLELDLGLASTDGFPPEHVLQLIDLADPDINRRHFDPITDTYLMSMLIPQGPAPTPVRITARYLAIDGRIHETFRTLPHP